MDGSWVGLSLYVDDMTVGFYYCYKVIQTANVTQ